MRDGTGILDNPTHAPRENRIVIPPGKFEAPRNPREVLSTFFDAFLTPPERIGIDTTGKKLAHFLADTGYITDIKPWPGSWGYAYRSDQKAILTPEQTLPHERYPSFVVFLGRNRVNGEHLWPKYEEMDQYRFLHEVNHGYQEYLMDQDGGRNWHDRAVRGEVDSHLGILFQFCYAARSNQPGRGVTTWGNQPDYNTIADERSQRATRAIEDANELITMSLWHPDYLKTYLQYISLQLPGYTRQNLAADGLTEISLEQASTLGQVVTEYVEEMNRTIVLRQ